MTTPTISFAPAKPALEALFALHRVALTGAEALAELHVEGIRSLSKQATAAQSNLPDADVAAWAAGQAKALPAQAHEALGATRRAYTICATTTADWMGICALQSERLSKQSLDAVENLIKLTPGNDSAQSAHLRQSMESAYRSYKSMLDAFRRAAESVAAAGAEPAPTNSKTPRR